MSKFLVLVLLLILGRLPEALAGDCPGIDLQLNPSYYDFGSANQMELSLTVTKKNSKDECDFFIGFGNGASSNSQRRGLKNGQDEFPIQFWKDRGRGRTLRDLPEASSDQDVISGKFTRNGPMSMTFSYLVEVDDRDNKSYGDYQDKFFVHLYEGSVSPSAKQRQNCLLHLVFRRPRKAEISLVDSGAPFNFFDRTQTLDFGELSQGQTLGCDAVIIYNAGFKLWIQSVNNGRLRHRGKGSSGGNGNKFIPYSTQVRGVPVSWPAHGFYMIASGHGVSPPSGDRYPITTTIGPLGSAPAGNYWDDILIRVESL